jgi:hypothetical protein
MALLWFDSFDHYVAADMGQKWSPVAGGGTGNGVLTIGATSGRRSTQGLRLIGVPNSGNSGFVQRTFTPSGNTCIVGVASKWVSGVNAAYALPGSESPCVIGIRLNGATQCWLYLNVGSGLLELYRGSTQLQVASAGMSIGSYPFIEIMAVIATGTAGSVQVRINNTLVMDVSGINTANSGTAGWNQIKLGQMASTPGSSGANMELAFDDCYVCDGSGAAPWNTFLGDCSAVASYPTAEGAASDWTPLSGTDNALMVKEATADGDTSYVSTITPGATDVYVTPDTAPGATLLGVQVSLQLKKEDAGSCVVNAVARVGTTNYPLPVPNPGTAYAIGSAVFTVNPATGLPWTEAEYNAAQFGFARV